MPEPASFRARVEAGDFAGLADLLADDVVFVSPIAHKPYAGKAITAAILRGVGRVFTDFRYLREYRTPGGQALMFETKVGDKTITGCDFLTYNAAGLVSELMVMVRPLSGANALAEAMGAQFDQITAEALAP